MHATNFFLLQAVGDAFNEGLYEVQARLRGIPLLESRPKQYMRKMTAREACRNKKVDLIRNIFKCVTDVCYFFLVCII